MWLKKLLKQSDYATSSPSGGAGSDLGVASDNVLGLHGEGRFFEETPNREERYKKRRKRWRSLKGLR